MLNFKRVNISAVILLLSMVLYAVFLTVIPLYFYLIVFFAWLIITSIGSFNITWNYHVKAINFVQTETKQIAITFDDGPNIQYTQKVLGLLEEFNAKASFFCIGKQIEKYPELLREINEKGHVIGNHTFNHSNNWGFLSTKKIEKELLFTDRVIEKVINKKPRFFRPPFGVTNPSIAKALNKTKHRVLGWSIRSLDTVIEDENKVLKRILPKIKPGAIILLHDNQNNVVPVLEQLLIFLKNNNYNIVSLETLTNEKAYE
ncbi:polysaccharide deacetylase family protein [Tenacibaculum halocynthiae]|uniref:polysaccharide deacetylase family protein n=1 Tax=Tenacibaculum halocynthiae TaxID=1254437 RepID=UPI0038954B40